MIVIVKNEENMIRGCLESVKWADELIVADNGSTDGTLEIVKRYTKNIIKFEGQDFAALRNRAIGEAKGDWVLYIDADERVMSPLKEEIIKTISETSHSAFALNRQNIIFGQPVNYGPYANDWMIRLLKKSNFKTWVGKVHEYAQFEGTLGYCKDKLLHLTHRDVDQIVIKSLEWSKIDAQLRIDAKHPKITTWRLIRIFKTESFKQLLSRKGIFGGTVGFMDAMLQVFSLFITYVRLWQLQQKPSLDEKYKLIDQKLIESNFQNY